MDKRLDNIYKQIIFLAVDIFKENTVGIYIHGSIAMNCFNWDNSDIDFLVVLKEKPILLEKEKYILGLLEINKICPKKELEMSIVLEKYTKDFVYPTPFELHLSKMYSSYCQNNLEKYCQQMNGYDKDLAAHFTITINRGFTIYGKDIKDVFLGVDKKYYFDSIKYDIDEAKEEILTKPVYYVLNLCRVLAYKVNNLILSKKEGGLWGIRNLPQKYQSLLYDACENYQNKYHQFNYSDEFLIDYAKYMQDEIEK